ncbi:MAG: response regulator [Bacteroidales bacterium]|jgi:DNA-binding NtrC family response regulator|nr:response regulator [Bacteroidales bacterium]
MDDPGGSILLIQEEVNKDNGIEDILKKGTYKVSSVFSAENVEKTTEYDLFAINIDGSEESEIEQIKKIHKISKDSPIVVFTNSNNDKFFKKLLSSGATEYIKKPFEEEKVLDIIAEVLNLKRWYKEINSDDN